MMLAGAEDLVAVERGQVPALRDAASRARRSLALGIAGRSLVVHFDDDAAGACFAARYADLALSGVPLVAQHAFAFRHAAAGPLFWSQDGPAFRWPHGELDADAVAFFADAVALTEFFERHGDGAVSLHAAAVGIAGAAAALVGDTTAGKTTTALACARIGLRLYSDERCVLGRDGAVHPFPRALNVREAGRALLLRDRVTGPDPLGERLRARASGPWSDVRFGELVPDWVLPEPAPLRAVFVLAGAGERVRLEPASRLAAVRAAARWARGAGTGLDKVARLHELFAGAACHRLELGSPDASARAIRAALLSARDELERSA